MRVVGTYSLCGKNKVYHRHLDAEMAILFVHMEAYTENTIT